MKSKIKNLLLFIVIAGVLTAGYIYFFGGKGEEANIVSYEAPESLNQNTSSEQSQVSDNSSFNQDLLGLLLSVKSIKLDDSIFRDPAFIELRDSSIVLEPATDEGRPNPFAPIGFDIGPVFTNDDVAEEDVTDSSTDETDLDLDLGLDELDNLLDF